MRLHKVLPEYQGRVRLRERAFPLEIYGGGPPDRKELVDLTFAIITINSWYRLAISFRTPPGSYEPDYPVARKQVPARHN